MGNGALEGPERCWARHFFYLHQATGGPSLLPALRHLQSLPRVCSPGFQNTAPPTTERVIDRLPAGVLTVAQPFTGLAKK